MFGLPAGISLFRPASSAVTYTSTLSTFFDGVNDFVDLGTPADLTRNLASTEFAISAWIKVTDLSANRYIVAKALPFAPDIGYIFAVGTSGQLFGYFGHTATTATANSLITTNTWYHVGYQVASNTGVCTGSLWINGVHQTVGFTVTPLTNSSPSVNVRIGGAGNAATGVQLPFQGYIDEVSFWNTSLTSARWLELYNSGRPGNVLAHSFAPSKVMHYYKMGEGDTFPVLTDFSGSATGTVISGTAANFTSSVPP